MCQSVLRMLLEQQAEMKEDLRIIKALLNELIRYHRGEEALSGQLPASVNLPLKTVKDVEELEEQLRSDEIYAKLVSRARAFNSDCTQGTIKM